MTPYIIYEDENVLAINKPAGMLVHAVRGKFAKSEPDLVDWIVDNRPEIKDVGDAKPHVGQSGDVRPGIVHRLDRETSGVMLIAKNQKTFEYLKKLFQTRDIKKTYLALVHGKVEEGGVIDKSIGIKDGSVKRTVHTARAKMVRDAVTEYEVLKHLTLNSKQLTLLKVYPKTGRTHQIRVHLASIGHPVVGDKLYGKKTDEKLLKRHFLHADSIEFTAPDGRRVRLSADLPEELALFVDKLA